MTAVCMGQAVTISRKMKGVETWAPSLPKEWIDVVAIPGWLKVEFYMPDAELPYSVDLIPAADVVEVKIGKAEERRKPSRCNAAQCVARQRNATTFSR
jgi:hypothetical protein